MGFTDVQSEGQNISFGLVTTGKPKISNNSIHQLLTWKIAEGGCALLYGIM
jgi:hypothetical protein